MHRALHILIITCLLGIGIAEASQVSVFSIGDSATTEHLHFDHYDDSEQAADQCSHCCHCAGLVPPAISAARVETPSTIFLVVGVEPLAQQANPPYRPPIV